MLSNFDDASREPYPTVTESLRALPDVIVNVALAGRSGTWDLDVAAGRVLRIRPHRTGSTADPGRSVLDAAGYLLMPGLVDSHVHLDKAYQLHRLAPSHDDGLDSALRATAQLRASQPLSEIAASADRLINDLHRHGTVAARAHVEVGAHVALDLVDVHTDLADRHPEIELQLCAFPQHGTTDDGGEARLERALDKGCDVVGGCPYADADPRRHLAFVAALARDRRLPLDLHLDLSDVPSASQLDLALDTVERFGLQGRTAFGHMTTLTAMAPEEATRLIRRIADLNVTVIGIPTTDLYLSGRDVDRAPTRGLTRIRELWEHGARVSLASNNHENAFTPISGGGLLRVAWLASLIGQFGSLPDQVRLFEAITTVPADLLGISLPAIESGSVLKHILVDAVDPADAVRKAPAPSAVLTASGMYVPPSLHHAASTSVTTVIH